MAVRKESVFSFKPAQQLQQPPQFSVAKVSMDTSCIVHKDEQSDLYKIYFIEDGEGRYQVDFKQFEIKGAGLFFLSPGQVLEVKSESVSTAWQLSFNRDFYCVETHGREIACNGVLFNNVHRASAIAVPPEKVPQLASVLQQLSDELQQPGPAHQSMLEAQLRLLLVNALRLRKEPESFEATDPQTESSQLVADFIRLVDKHFRKHHAVGAYAEMLAVAPKSLAKRLQARGYSTPGEMIRARIVLQAKRELRFSKKSVKEIAYELGFEDPAYFTRYFKKSAEESPLAYREAFRE